MDVEKSVGTTSPESARKSTKRYRENPENRVKLRAKWRIQSKVRSGELKKPSKCPKCGRAVPLDAHHNKGHKNKESIVWRCHKCHSQDDPARNGARMRESMKHAKSNK